MLPSARLQPTLSREHGINACAASRKELCCQLAIAISLAMLRLPQASDSTLGYDVGVHRCPHRDLLHNIISVHDFLLSAALA